jgi:hypothetical protein
MPFALKKWRYGEKDVLLIFRAGNLAQGSVREQKKKRAGTFKML